MNTPPIRPAAERFATLLGIVVKAVMKRTGWALTHNLIALILTRVQNIKRRVARLVARIAAGTYKPPVPREQKSADRPRPAPPKDPLPRTFGWLRPLITPDTIAFSGMLDSVLRDPEMVALMQAAPEAFGRPIRSLCRMFGIAPPPALALPPRRRRPRPPKPPKPPMPKWPHDHRRRDRYGFYIGPPPMLGAASPLRAPRKKSS